MLTTAHRLLLYCRSDWSRTIYARGRDEDYVIMTRGRLLDRIRVVLAGRAAEEVALGAPSTYGTTDLRVGVGVGCGSGAGGVCFDSER